MPTRNPKQPVTFIKCQEGYACIDVTNFKSLLSNEVNTETYIEQLNNLLNEVTTPIK